MNLFHHVLPEDDSRNAYGTLSGTGLFGAYVKSFGYMHGNTNNGKGLLSNLTLKVCGVRSHNYGMMASDGMFTSTKPDRATMAKLDRKRFVLLDEVDKRDVLNGNEIKKYTGNTDFTQRHFNSSKTENESHMTLIINCNEEVDICPYDEAVRDRLIKIEFLNEYVKDEADADVSKRKYLQNTLYASQEWLNAHRCAWFHVLSSYLQMYLTGGKVIVISKRLQQHRDKFLINCNDFATWFNEIAVHTGNKDEGICIKDLKGLFQSSLYFQKLPARQQRKSVAKKIMTEINGIKELKTKFKKRKMVNGVCFRAVITEYEYKDDSLKTLFSLASQINLRNKSKKVVNDGDNDDVDVHENQIRDDDARNIDDNDLNDVDEQDVVMSENNVNDQRINNNGSYSGNKRLASILEDHRPLKKAKNGN